MQPSERWNSGEPTLDEMLADPIVRLLMARDGLSEESVRSAFALAAARLRGRPDGIHRGGLIRGPAGPRAKRAVPLRNTVRGGITFI